MSQGSVAAPAPVHLVRSSAVISAVAWTVTLIAVGLPAILLDAAGIGPPGWLAPLSVAPVVGALLASLVSATLRPLARYWVVLLLLLPATNTALWPAAITDLGIQLPAGTPALGNEMVRELALAVVVILALLVLGYRRRDAFLVAGDLSAPARPIRWLIDRPISWALLGPISALAIALGTLAFVMLGVGGPSLDRLLVVAPGVLLISAINAFSEEVTLRAGPLATLRSAVGDRQAVLLAVAIFGIPHYAGVPGGLIGAAMAGIFAWWVCKAMLETRGLAWPWFIHLTQDVVIFSFLLAAPQIQ